MRIGELARRAGVHIQTVRYYERRGVLGAPLRLPSGYRDSTKTRSARSRSSGGGRRSVSPFVKLAVALTFFNSWVLFAEVVVDRQGLWRYMPGYRSGRCVRGTWPSRR
jgi:hypothetical protein